MPSWAAGSTFSTLIFSLPTQPPRRPQIRRECHHGSEDHQLKVLQTRWSRYHSEDNGKHNLIDLPLLTKDHMVLKAEDNSADGQFVSPRRS